MQYGRFLEALSDMPANKRMDSVLDYNIMAEKEHGTCRMPVQASLRFDAKRELSDGISCYNRFFAEPAGYYQNTSLEKDLRKNGQLTFYDSVTGKPLFVAPRDRSVDEFLAETKSHGWPSFRDQEVVWDNVRVLADGEMVSIDGTHLGHNLPDKHSEIGRSFQNAVPNRYCINLVSIAGWPTIVGSA